MFFKNQLIKNKNANKFSNNSFSLVNELKDAVSGKDGEITGILTYLFQHFIVDDEKTSEALAKIAKDEMEHLEVLLHLITKLGEMPYYINSNNNFFTSRYVNYQTNPKLFLNDDLEGEKLAIKKYNYILENTDNEEVKSVITEIIEDETNHAEILKRLINSFSDN